MYYTNTDQTHTAATANTSRKLGFEEPFLYIIVRLLGLGLIIAGLFLHSKADGQTYVWDGGTGTGTTWTTAANWSPDGVPISAASSNLVFDNRTGNSVATPNTIPGTLYVNSATRNVGLITFDDQNAALPSALNISSNFTAATTTNVALTISTGITLQNTSKQVLFNGGTAATNDHGPLSVILGANNTFTTSTNSYLQFNSGTLISGSYGITTAGTGTVGLNGPNLFSGGVTVGNGSTLRVGNNLQGNSSSSTVSGGGLQSGQVGTGLLTLQDGSILLSGGSGDRSLQNNLSLSGNVTIGAVSTYTGGFTFNSASGTTTSDQTLTTPATISLTGNASLTNYVPTTFSDTVSGGYSLALAGSGPLILSAQNTFTGGVTIKNGATLRVGSSSTVVGNVLIDGPVGTGTITLQDGATLTPTGGATRTMQNSLNLSGNIIIGATATYNGNISFSGNSLSTPSTVTLAGATTLVTNVNTSIGTAITGNFSLTKQGLGALTLGQNIASSYAGGTTIASGSVLIGVSASLGTGGINLGSVGGGNASLLNNLGGYTQSNAITVVAGSGGVLTLGYTGTAAFTSIFSGPITLNDDLVVRSDAAAGFSLRLSGNISGSKKLTTATNSNGVGTGTIILSSNNAGYSGLTTIAAGTILQVGNAGTTGGVGTGDVVDNGSLIVNRTTAATLTNAISGPGTLIQAGTGSTKLANANNYTGATTVSAGTLEISGSINGTTSVSVTGGTLLLSGVSEAVNDAAALNLSANTNVSFASGLSNRTETFNALNLLGSTILDFGDGGANQLAFLNGVTGLGTYTLSVYNWSSGGAQDVLALSNTLSQGELDNIKFYSDGAGASYLGSGGEIAFGGPAYQIVPVPEPSGTALIGATALLALIGFRERHRLLIASKRTSV